MTVLADRTVAELVRNILIIGLMIVVGYVAGFRFHAGLAGAVACIAIVAPALQAMNGMSSAGMVTKGRIMSRSSCSRMWQWYM
jgi:hypothetical protein